ncbi:MAG TPA: HAMP domain-containing sensor histidine kinase, partial [Holophagaceae bacterium]
ATATGLFAYQGQAWRELRPPGGPAVDALCLAVSPGSGGGPSTLWIGTRGAGLLHVQQGQWSRTDPMPRYPKNWITSLHVETDPSGHPYLWAGTRGQGLGRLDLADPRAPWRVFDARGKVPIPNTVIYGIEEDRAGRIYLGASGGIERLTFSPDRQALVRVETFNAADGLLTNIVNPGASLLDHQGRVWFGLPEGPAFLDPSESVETRGLPAPVLERFLVDGVEARPTPGLRFPHGTDHLAFAFFAPDYFREEDLRFRTQLVGLDRTPGPWTFENVRDFAGLGAGSYELRIWVSSREGRISPPLRFPFAIRPSPWLHHLALALYLLVAALLFISIIRFRTRMLERRNAWLQVRVDEATEELSRKQQSLQVLADHLYRQNEEKSLFMGMAAHDLRNPLQGIRLKAELLALEAHPACQSAAQGISGAVDEVLSLLNRLLDLEALETGHRRQAHQTVPLTPMLDRARSLHQPRARAKAIELLLEGPTPAPAALADPDTLAEVVDNLLTNAIKFSPPDRRVWLGAEQRGSEAVLWIRDEGPGFRPEDKPQAFKRFAKLSARPTAGETSTGLGLAIVKRLVEDMGGRIELESEAGQGAALFVSLPLAGSPDPA